MPQSYVTHEEFSMLCFNQHFTPGSIIIYKMLLNSSQAVQTADAYFRENNVIF